MDKNNQNGQEEDFATLFESSYSSMDSLEPGQAVEKAIVSITGEYVFLELDGKSEGVLEKAELQDKEGNLSVKEGDVIKAYFVGYKNGEMHFTTKLKAEGAGSEMLENAFSNGIPVEGFVEKEIKGGFEIKFGKVRAFCPFSQMDVKRVENAADYVGKNLTFKITEYKEKGRNILVSNRAILEEEKQKQIDELKGKLKVGMVVNGTVLSLRDFGAFVDISGFQALLPISEISRTRVEDINAVLNVGDEIEASIIRLDWERERISISMKALLKDPWDEATDKYKAGSKHKGKVVRITDFGAFVSLEPGLDGLVHISDLKGDSRDSDPRKFVKKGQELSVVIDSIDTARKRISLKPASSVLAEEEYNKYVESDSDTYNPFADFFKDKK